VAAILRLTVQIVLRLAFVIERKVKMDNRQKLGIVEAAIHAILDVVELGIADSGRLTYQDVVDHLSEIANNLRNEIEQDRVL
jgi:phage-related protein